ncbi:MAG: YceI family protein [Saprospiraceae bacterium]|nr:YceI family protein [Candidatus Parvibacillus calidus]MBX2937736.1 YceI family protein [Saprospiraceae bacterium]MBX7178134.1 YceI family protein [Saprospiraceae bacterium]MCB0590513.1 YceI family protein [Saprospiraceae bacterium]MCO5282017.1 YceI family protein [Saprospiraceae bacterium]
MMKFSGAVIWGLIFAVLVVVGCKKTDNQEVATGLKDTIIVEPTIPPIDSNTDREVDMATVSGNFIIEAPSTINWTASDPVSTHVGTVDVTSGNLEIKDGKIQSGSFEIDLHTINSTDLKPEDGKEKLETQLKSADFFNVEKFPSAKFVIKKSVVIKGNDKTRHHITGDLTIRDVTKSIGFDAYIIVSNQGGLLTATTPSFEINRVDYGMKYKSGVINTAKDKIISDKIGMLINLRAKKQ